MSQRPEVSEAFNTWEWDNAAGGFRALDAPGAAARSLYELSQGAYDVIGSTIRDRANGRIVGNLSTVHGSTLSVGDAGSLFLNNGIAAGDVNQAGGRTVMQRASITVRIPGDDLNDPIELRGVTSLTHFGGGIYTVQGNPRGPADFERVDLVPDRTVEGEPTRFNLPLNVGLYRRATPTETLRRSVNGWIARNAFEEILNRVQGLSGKRSGSDIPGIDDIVDQLGITVEVAPFITYNLTGA